jgi:hypothetical protein
LDAVDDVALPFDEEPVKVDRPSRVFLEIAVEYGNEVACRRLHPGEKGPVLTNVSRQVDPDYAMVTFGKVLRDLPPLVRTAVIDENRLKFDSETLGCLNRKCLKLLYAMAGSEYRRDNRKLRSLVFTRPKVSSRLYREARLPLQIVCDLDGLSKHARNDVCVFKGAVDVETCERLSKALREWQSSREPKRRPRVELVVQCRERRLSLQEFHVLGRSRYRSEQPEI